jgi:hypothetical protein
MSYEIQSTGLSGWMAIRYQYNIGTIDRFGYAETLEEAKSILQKAGIDV